MRLHALILAALVAGSLASPDGADAQVGVVVRKGGAEIAEALSRYVAGRGGRDIGEEAAARALGERLLSGWGEDVLQRGAALVREAGPTAVRALSAAARPDRLLKALDALPAKEAPRALAALDRGAYGRMLAKQVEAFGDLALKAELRHPGLAEPIARGLGRGGLEAAAAGDGGRARLLARLVQEADGLPQAERTGLIDLLGRNTEAVLSFLERHPKFALTATGAAFLAANSERILGGSDIVVDAQGVPHLVRTPGLLADAWRGLWQAAFSLLTPFAYALAFVLAVLGIARGLFRRNVRERKS